MQRLGRFLQRDAVTRSPEQWHAYPCLKLLDLLADGTGCHAHRFGRALDALIAPRLGESAKREKRKDTAHMELAKLYSGWRKDRYFLCDIMIYWQLDKLKN